MVASLARFGTDFGQGHQDRRFFQVDDEHARYVAEKRAAPWTRRFVVGDDPLAAAARAEALAWMRATLEREHPSVAAAVATDSEAVDPFDAIARHVQEDFAILQAGPEDRGRTLVVDVRFPSGWHPERLREADFTAIHRPVPGFPPTDQAARSMVRAMVDRGPYVRFVWTVGADPGLDQHPDRGDRRRQWEGATQAFLRVERQVTVPLPETRSSVFLIRVHVTPVTRLSAEQRAVLLEALRVMPDEVRRYKSLPEPAVLQEVLAAQA